MSLVRIERERAGLTISALARKAKMHLPTLSKIENGHRQLKVDEVARLAKAIGCDPRALIPEGIEEEAVGA